MSSMAMKFVCIGLTGVAVLSCRATDTLSVCENEASVYHAMASQTDWEAYVEALIQELPQDSVLLFAFGYITVPTEEFEQIVAAQGGEVVYVFQGFNAIAARLPISGLAALNEQRELYGWISIGRNGGGELVPCSGALG